MVDGDEGVRFASSADAGAIERIENDADRLLIDRLAPADWPAAEAGTARVAGPGFVLVAVGEGGTVVGFAHVTEVAGLCHLEQLSVDPTSSRRGWGRRLLVAAMRVARERAHERMTLRTYADVPWNAPFYATVGFVEEAPVTAFHRGLVDVERRLGLDAHGRRVQMAVDLTRRPRSRAAVS